MNILSNVRKVPGGLMLVPLLISSLINTINPDILHLGEPMSAIVSKQGTMCIITILLVYTGIHFQPKHAKLALQRGGQLIVFKYIIAVLVGFATMHFFGLDGVAGISTLAIVIVVTSCNPGLYLALMEQYGDDVDKANFAILAIVGLPFIPICLLGYADGAGIDYASIVATIVPVAFGMVLGTVDQNIRNFTKDGLSLMLPFLGFALGGSINLIAAFSSMGSGIILFILFSITNIIPLILFDRLVLKQKGYAAAAISSVGGMSMVVPLMMAEINPNYAPYTDSAKAQIALLVVVCVFVSPILTKRFAVDRNEVVSCTATN